MVKHRHNRQFFDQLTSKSCYWGGFLAADGSLSKQWGGIRLGLSEKDKEQVEKFKQAIDSTSPVRCFDTSNGYRCAQIDIYGAYECHLALKEDFNITPNKSLTLQSPNLQQEDDIRAFLRGYMDGDGSISWSNDSKRKGHWQLSLIGTQQMLAWIKSQLQEYVNPIGNPSVLPDRNVFQLVFGCEQIVRILDWLYQDSTDAIRLTRKYNKYLEAKQYYQQNPTRIPRSKYRGVGRNRIGKWTAEIKEPQGRRFYLGCFVTEREAALAYNIKARELGLFSRCYEIS